jgi:hypothetical protein
MSLLVGPVFDGLYGYYVGLIANFGAPRAFTGQIHTTAPPHLHFGAPPHSPRGGKIAPVPVSFEAGLRGSPSPAGILPP